MLEDSALTVLCAQINKAVKDAGISKVFCRYAEGASVYYNIPELVEVGEIKKHYPQLKWALRGIENYYLKFMFLK